MIASAARLSTAAGDLHALAGWASRESGAAAELVSSGESCFDTVGAAWSGPRASAAVAAGRAYLRGQRGVSDALADASGVLHSFASIASEFASRARASEQLLARTDLATEGAPEVIASARARLSSLGAEWQAVCRGFAGRLDACADTVTAAAAARPDLAGLGSGSAGVYGFGGAGHGALGANNPLLGFLAPLLSGSLAQGMAWLLGRAGSMTGAAQLLLAIAAGRAGDEVADDLGDLPAAEVAAYWDSLSEHAQNALIDARPDVAAFVVLANGGTLTEDQLDRLDAANAYGTFATEFTASVEASAGARVVSVTFDGEFSAVVTTMSDGSVEMVLLVGAGIGLGLDGSYGGVGGDARAGAYGQVFQVLTFDDVDDAAEAIDKLEEAAEAGLAVWDMGPGGQQTPGTVASTGSMSSLGDLLSPLDELQGTWNAIFGGDSLSEQVEELFDEHGVLTGYESGVYAAAEGELDLAGLAEGEIEVEVSLGEFTNDPSEGSDEPARTGMILSGEVLGRVETDPGPAVQTEGAFVVQVYEEGGGQFASITVQATAEGGMAGEIFDAAGIEIDAQAMGGGRATVELTVPVSADLLPSLESVITGLPTGSIGGNALVEVIDASEMSLTLESTRTMYTETEFDAGVVSVEIETTATSAETQVALHKYPHGPVYSPETVDGLVEAELDD